MPNPKNIEAHKWKKGQSGNPKGRPPKLPMLQEVIEKILNTEKGGVTAIEAVVMALHAKAVKGDVKAISELLDRYYGKSKMNIDLTEHKEHTYTIVELPAKDPLPDFEKANKLLDEDDD